MSRAISTPYMEWATASCRNVPHALVTLLKKSQSKLLGPTLGDIKWSTASIRSRVGQLNALAFLDDLWAKTFSTTSLVRAASRLFLTPACEVIPTPRYAS